MSSNRIIKIVHVCLIFHFCSANGDKEVPSVTAKKCNLNIGKLDIEFHGGARFVYICYNESVS